MNTSGIIGHKNQIKKIEVMLSKGMMPQSMIFTGVPGIGKQVIARRLIKSIFCEDKENSPCRKCHSCIQILKETFPDTIFLSPDEKGKIPIGKSDKKEPGSVRWLIDKLSKKAQTGNYGVLIDGVDKISIEGQNALLKTIEEPPIGTHIILLASNRSKILPTILSRCSEISFNPLNAEELESILGESNIEESILSFISEISGGSLEAANILKDKRVLNEILSYCSRISRFIADGSEIDFNITSLQKDMANDLLIDIIINIYRKILFDLIHERDVSEMLKPLMIKDSEDVVKLIKILIQLRKGLSNNLNLTYSLKGMLYANALK